MVSIPATLSSAIRHYGAGELQEAALICRQILADQPNHPETLHLLGVIEQQEGRNEVAVGHFQRAIGLNPANAEFHNSLGAARLALREFGEAVACCRKALQLEPTYSAAHVNLGNAWKTQGRLADAIACYQRALQLRPDVAETHYNLGNAWLDQGKLELAAACYRQAIELQPAFAGAYNNLGAVCRDLGFVQDAFVYCRRATQLRPHDPTAQINLGLVHTELQQPLLAQEALQRALQLRPDSAPALYYLGNIHRDQGRFDEAIHCYEGALQSRPDFAPALGTLINSRQHVCRWQELDPLAKRLIESVDAPADSAGDAAVSPLSLLAAPLETSARQQLRCARRWVDRQLRGAAKTRRIQDFTRPQNAGPRTKIGYLSADFRAHAVAYLTAELFERHDRERFEIFGYSYGPDDRSPMRQRLVRAFDRFVDLASVPYGEAAQRIADDRIDVLVDLTGYTKSARTQILAMRPAPIQVNYLGYPGTMGAPFIDHIIVDDYVVPSEQQPFFAEKLVHLPGCYQVNSRREISACTPTRAQCGLPERGFVFCAFHSSHKIAPAVFEVWMELLRQVPGSVLWLLERNRFACENLRSEAEGRGVSSERLVFAPHRPLSEHLARFRQADLFLDTFPYNGHTTASDALWAGCPLLTISGQTFASRVAGSLLSTVGLPELITTSLDEYRDQAQRLASDPQQLAAFRRRLEANRDTSGLFDVAAFARKIETAYVAMCERRTTGGS